MSKESNGRPFGTGSAAATEPDAGYKVGPWRPPKEHQFKPGQSGNPKGAKRKSPPIAPDLKAAARAGARQDGHAQAGRKATDRYHGGGGNRAVGCPIAKGDRHGGGISSLSLTNSASTSWPARRMPSRRPLPQITRHPRRLCRPSVRQVAAREAVLAPPELLDDDPDDQNRN